jgi:Secretion system C-terminal sorting domain
MKIKKRGSRAGFGPGKYFLLFIALAIILTCYSFAQSITWQRTYTSKWQLYTYCNDMCDANNGNFFGVGVTRDSTGRYFDYVLKLNPYGDTIWSRTIDSVGGANSCASSGDGGVIIVGEGNYALKLDSAGNITWRKNYGLTGVKCFDVVRITTGGFIMCGERLSFNESGFHYDGYISRINSDGVLIWDTTFPSGFTRRLNSIVETIDGFICTGIFSSAPTDTAKCLVMKINLTGYIIWERLHKVFNNGAGGIVICNITGGFLITGTTADSTNSFNNTYIMKVNDNGDKYYEKRMNSNITERPHDMKVINDKYALSLYRNIARSLIIDTLGNIIYEKLYPSQYYTILQSILPLPNGDIIWGGTANLSGSMVVGYVVRTDSLLNSPPIGVQQLTNYVPKDFVLYQNYPNPFNPQTAIVFKIIRHSFITLSVYNLTGEKIEELVNAKLESGEYKVEFSGSNLASGIYFYQLSENNRIVDSKKMVLLK